MREPTIQELLAESREKADEEHISQALSEIAREWWLGKLKEAGIIEDRHFGPAAPPVPPHITLKDGRIAFLVDNGAWKLPPPRLHSRKSSE